MTLARMLMVAGGIAWLVLRERLPVEWRTQWELTTSVVLFLVVMLPGLMVARYQDDDSAMSARARSVKKNWWVLSVMGIVLAMMVDAGGGPAAISWRFGLVVFAYFAFAFWYTSPLLFESSNQQQNG